MKKLLAMMMIMLLIINCVPALAATTAEQIEKWKLAYYEKNNYAAANNVGVCYAEGDGVEQNDAEAAKWYRFAAEGGNKYAQSNLGYRYYYGKGVEQNYAEAVKWFRLSADQGHATAQNMLGICYSNGQGVEQNYTEAVKYYRLAVDQGNSHAQHNLGLCYEYGEGVEKDIDEAIRWYTLAANQGYEKSQKKLEALTGSAATTKPTATAKPTATPKPTATTKPTVKPTATPKANEWLLVDSNGLYIEVTGFEYERFSSGSSYLNMYANVKNNTGHQVNIFINDAYVNGVEVNGTGMVNVPNGAKITKEDDKEFFFSTLSMTNTASAEQQLENPRTLTFEIRVTSDATYEELYKKTFTISGPANLEKKIHKPTATSTPSTKNSSSSGVPNIVKNLQKIKQNSTTYPYLCKGDKGEDVRKLQQRLISLGYLNDSADGIYGSNTAQAVYYFRDQNGLNNVSDRYAADNAMQQVLFGSSAKSYTEPYYGLIIPNGSYGQWKEVSGNKISMRIKVQNVTRTKTIKAFELHMYATDVYGDRIYGPTRYYYGTTTKRIAPGETVYSDYMTMPNRSQVDRMYVAISRIVYTDGTVRENPSPDYAHWDIRW